MAAFRKVNGLRDMKRSGILHHATRVAWRELDVLDDGVMRIVRIQLAEGTAGNGLVRTGDSEGRAVLGRGNLGIHSDLDHARFSSDNTRGDS